MKYKLTDEKIKYWGRTLYRIQSLKDFGDVKVSDLGGWIESERNLSQEGNCWVYDEAKVFDNAEVFGGAKIFGKAEVYYNARVFDDAEIKNGTILG